MPRRRRSRDRNRTANRGRIVTATPRVALPKINVSRLLREHDRRRFHPSNVFRPIGVRWASRLVVAPVRRNKVIARPFRSGIGNLNHVVSFKVPKRVSVCVRRRQRREVLFAKRKVRSGRGSPKHRTEWSDVSCR